MSLKPISMTSLIEIGPELVWLQPSKGTKATAFFRTATGAVQTRQITDLELEFLECADGSKSKSEIGIDLGITAEQFDEVFQGIVRWAPKALGVRNSDADAAQKRHNSIAAAVELRDIWAAMSAKKDDNDQFHKTGIDDAPRQFDTIETTISHCYREPTKALQNRTYGEAFCDWLLKQDWLKPHAKIMEVGCGLGYFANAVLTALSQHRPEIYGTITYTMFDLSPDLAKSQRQTCNAHLDKIRFLHGNIETFEFGDERFDTIISNEVIADLSVETFDSAEVQTHKPTSEAARLALAYDLELPATIKGPNARAVLNVGAIHFVETIARCLSENGKAILTEYGTLDGSPKAVHFINHQEFTVQFSHLVQVAQQNDLQTDLQKLGDMLDFDRNYAPLDIASFHILSDAVLPYLDKPPLPNIAYSYEMLKAELGSDLDRIRNLMFRPLSHPQSFTPFRFYALTLER
ncbi:class I SAM-dependent methyltransferase [Planktotalea sp.]|uniref:class I SAM-dependent methyltransferase n=1 Tax=Planktotalea sp. TaxID=2029877 RepID=UPI00329A49FC